MIVRFIPVNEDARLPALATPDSACYDCYAQETVTIYPGHIALVPLGFSLGLPSGWEAQIRPRSGLAIRNYVVALLGTIDADYKDELQAIIQNHGSEPYRVAENTRICQLALRRILPQPEVFPKPIILLDTREGGFGSTGES